jgi:hypothetical protein
MSEGFNLQAASADHTVLSEFRTRLVLAMRN